MCVKWYLDLRKKIAGEKATNYGISNGLKFLGINVSVNTLDGYERPDGKNVRTDVLNGLLALAQVSGNEWVKIADKEHPIDYSRVKEAIKIAQPRANKKR